MPPLHLSAQQHGHADVVRLLLHEGRLGLQPCLVPSTNDECEANGGGGNGATPLHRVSYLGGIGIFSMGARPALLGRGRRRRQRRLGHHALLRRWIADVFAREKESRGDHNPPPPPSSSICGTTITFAFYLCRCHRCHCCC